MGQKHNKGKVHYTNLDDHQVKDLTKLHKNWSDKGKFGAKELNNVLCMIENMISKYHDAKRQDYETIAGWPIYQFRNSIPSLSKDKVEEYMFKAVDHDGNGNIESAEFLAAVDKLSSKKRADRMEMCFYMASGGKPTLGEGGVAFLLDALQKATVTMKLTPDLTFPDFLKQGENEQGFIIALQLQAFATENTTNLTMFSGGEIKVMSATGKIQTLICEDGEEDVVNLKQKWNDKTGTPVDQIHFYTQEGVLLEEGKKWEIMILPDW